MGTDNAEKIDDEMREISGDFRESLADAVIESITEDGGALEVKLKLWNESPALLQFCDSAKTNLHDLSSLDGHVLEFLESFPKDEFSQEAIEKGANNGVELINYGLLNLDSKVVLKCVASGTKFFTSSPLLE